MDEKNQDLEQEISTWEKELRQGASLLKEIDNYEKSYQITFDSSDYEEFITHLSNYDVHCIDLATKHRQSQVKKVSLCNSISSTASSSTKNLSSIFKDYIKDKGSIEPKTSEGYTRHFNLFIRITNISTIEELSVLSIRRYKTILAQLPPRVGQDKKFINKPIDSILKMKYPKKLAFKTMKENLVTIRSFLQWLSVQMYVKNDLSGLLSNIKNPDSKKESEYRAAFSDSDLTKLFSIPEYQVDCFKKYSFRYWLPLLALYTGARANELCQLLVEDVYALDDILVFDINDKHNKKVKTKNAIRKIPIHKTILKLGFENYIETVKRSGEAKLFPDLKPDRHKDSARKLSRFFNESYKSYNGLLDRCGIEKHTDIGKKVFHSFRHTLINQWKQQRLDSSILKQIAGHSKSDLTLDTYGKDFPLNEVHKELNKINFEIEKLPRKWHKSFY